MLVCIYPSHVLRAYEEEQIWGSTVHTGYCWTINYNWTGSQSSSVLFPTYSKFGNWDLDVLRDLPQISSNARIITMSDKFLFCQCVVLLMDFFACLFNYIYGKFIMCKEMYGRLSSRSLQFRDSMHRLSLHSYFEFWCCTKLLTLKF